MKKPIQCGTVFAEPYEQDGELWVQLAQEQTSDPFYDTYVKVSDLEELIKELRKDAT